MTKAIFPIYSQEGIDAWQQFSGLLAFQKKAALDFWLQHPDKLPIDFSMVPKAARLALSQTWDWQVWKLVEMAADNQKTTKYLWEIPGAQKSLVECVLMPTANPTQWSLCLSCQVGCSMGCVFCQTGKMGLSRNLTYLEIVLQYVLVGKQLPPGHKITNIVFMGMGEPLDNYDHVVQACKYFIEVFGLSKHKIIISTCGLADQIKRLAVDMPVGLAISLHSAIEKTRNFMMPISHKYSLQDLSESLYFYKKHYNHPITFEYIMIAGKNDSIEHAKAVAKFVGGFSCKVQLIPMNPHPGMPFNASTKETIEAFQNILRDKHVKTFVRWSKGQEVGGACGQLASKTQEFLSMPVAKYLKKRLDK
jgi:23S rRNA (adenine2503-C2)-methyltransferase